MAWGWDAGRRLDAHNVDLGWIGKDLVTLGEEPAGVGLALQLIEAARAVSARHERSSRYTKSRTRAINALKGLLVTAPDKLRERLKGLTSTRLVRQAAALDPGRRPLADTLSNRAPAAAELIRGELGHSTRGHQNWNLGRARGSMAEILLSCRLVALTPDRRGSDLSVRVVLAGAGGRPDRGGREPGWSVL